MNPVPLLPQTAPTWREAIAPAAAPRPRNRTGRRRILLSSVRHGIGVGLVLASLVFGYIAWRAWHNNPAALAAPAPAASPLREIVVRSDGVLDRAWVERVLDVRPGVPLLSLDLVALRDRLVQSGQVRVAVVARRFPDVLTVTLEERSPVLRVHAGGHADADRNLFIARDGFVFPGENYAPAAITALPLLEGITLERDLSGRGFSLVPGMGAVSDLLGTARSSAPALAQTFQTVSLARYARDGVVVVRTAEVNEIAFGTRDDFYRQLARLDYILDEIRAKPGALAIRSINLAVGARQVPVAFEQPESTRAPSGSDTAPAASRPARSAPVDLATPSTLTFFRL